MRTPALWAVIVGICITASSQSGRADQWVQLTHPLSQKLRAIAEQFFLNDPIWKKAFPPISDYEPVDLDHDVAGALAHISDDSIPEAFFRIERPIWCGTEGCALVILKKQGKTWRDICEATAFEDRIKILESTDHGFHRLVVGYEVSGQLDVLNWRNGRCVGADDH